MWLVVAAGWREGTVYLAAAAFLMLVPVLFLMSDDPGRLGLRPYGAQEGEKPDPAVEVSPAPELGTVAHTPVEAQGGAVSRAVKTPEFWLLSGSFLSAGRPRTALSASTSFHTP